MRQSQTIEWPFSPLLRLTGRVQVIVGWPHIGCKQTAICVFNNSGPSYIGTMEFVRPHMGHQRDNEGECGHEEARNISKRGQHVTVYYLSLLP